MSTKTRPRFGCGWIDGEDDEEGNLWIQISELDYRKSDEGFLAHELAVVVLRRAEEMERRFPGITANREQIAALIVAALNAANERGEIPSTIPVI